MIDRSGNEDVPPPQNPAIPYLTAFIVCAVIASFAIVFGMELFYVWRGKPGDLPPWNQQVVNGLATLVGGIVAVAFAIKPATNQAGESGLALSQRNLFALGRFLAPSAKPRFATQTGAVYAVVYVVIGFAAIATWFFDSKNITPDLKSLATTLLGMIVPIVVGYFNQQ